jgi:methionyl-tRNA formyltransferase
VTTIFLSGSGWFGQTAADHLTDEGHTIVGVCSPATGRRGGRDLLALWAERTRTPWVERELLRPEDVPDGTDLILTAHSHAFIGARTRARARYALGYHPSLLPLHRGRDAVKWQARLNERVVGGSIYHLTNRVDGGPLAAQRHVIVPAGLTASRLWRTHLAPLGLDMLVEAAGMAGRGDVPVRPQDDRLATWEPSFDSAPVHRPELLELEA